MESNKVYLKGTIETKPVFSYETCGEKFYEFKLKIVRFSGVSDIVPITLSERIANPLCLSVGDGVSMQGQFRSFNKLVDDKSKLMLSVFVSAFYGYSENYQNEVELTGHLCKPPIFRITPFGREICDLLIAVNNGVYNKSDYIPGIAWGGNAKLVKDWPVGEKVTLKGRIQSREFTKKISETESEVRTAYELSISQISLVND